ncbi:hypothetical protein Vafri_2704 [Volvox africanus]|uniref:Core Histone H2A/H2B/H3 domain-containing protein n=1 Tax=Volvox africanus TaxID=51714 RepID=A0A8J4ES30_9CHLO|nr:hypothetical protein Vafri_2704 [Volvox africanus]
MGDAQAGFPGQFPGQFSAAYGMTQQGNHQAEQLKVFWQSQLVEVAEVPPDPTVFKNHQLPLARIKKIMKSDEDVRMISAEAPVLFAKACEMFILELTLRSWMHAEENKRRTLMRNDVAAAITKTDIFDFLLDIVPRDDSKQDDAAVAVGPIPISVPATAQAVGPAAAPAVSNATRAPGAVPHPAIGPGSLYFPTAYPIPPGALAGEPNQAATAAAAAAAMMRPPLPTLGVDPALVSLYQQQLLSGQAWPHIAGLPPPPTAQGAAAAAAVAAQAQQQAAAAAAVAAAAGAAQAAATTTGGTNATSAQQQQPHGQGQQGPATVAAATTSGQAGQQTGAQSEKKS